MMDFRQCTWDEEIIKIFENNSLGATENGFLNLLPCLADFDGDSTDLSMSTESFIRNGIPQNRFDGSDNPYWKRWPELRGHKVADEQKNENFCRLFLGIGDGAAANIGSKCGSTKVSAPRIAVTIGTSAAARVCLPLPIKSPPPTSTDDEESDIAVPPGLFCYRVDQNRLLLGGALTDGGSVVEWARSLLNLQSKEHFGTCMEKVAELYVNNCTSSVSASTATNSISMVPFLSGERSTGFRGGARACLSGITRETTPTHVMYACLEGVILRLGAILNLINSACNRMGGESETCTKSVLVASGNALERNPLWRQMLADCSGLDVIVDGESNEGTSRGVAILLAGSLKHSSRREQIGVDQLRDEETLTVEQNASPNSNSFPFWKKASLNQDFLIEAVSSTWTIG